MKIYSFDSEQSQQLIKKTYKELDNEITNIVNYIDNFIPNYVILNRKYTTDNIIASFYPTDSSGFINNIVYRNDEDEKIYINLPNMLPHQLVENTFGEDIYVIINGSTTETVPQGFAVCHNGYDSEDNILYSILPLSPSGGYFILTDIQPGENNSLLTTWTYDERAIDKYGLQDIVSFCLPGARFFYNQNDTENSDEDSNYDKIKKIDNHTYTRIEVSNYNSITPNSEWLLCCGVEGINDNNPVINPSAVWNKNFILDHNIISYIKYIKDNTTYYAAEEVFVDEIIETSQLRVGESPKSNYIINTNLKHNNLLDNGKLFINFY